MRSMPIFQSMVSVTTILASMPATRGGIKSGLRAMSANVAPGEKKTPAKRAAKDLGGSSTSAGETVAPMSEPPGENVLIRANHIPRENVAARYQALWMGCKFNKDDTMRTQGSRSLLGLWLILDG